MTDFSSLDNWVATGRGAKLFDVSRAPGMERYIPDCSDDCADKDYKLSSYVKTDPTSIQYFHMVLTGTHWGPTAGNLVHPLRYRLGTLNNLNENFFGANTFISEKYVDLKDEIPKVMDVSPRYILVSAGTDSQKFEIGDDYMLVSSMIISLSDDVVQAIFFWKVLAGNDIPGMTVGEIVTTTWIWPVGG
jgi:hypothetical protein